MRFFAEIRKIDAEQRLVYGYASTDALDSQGEIIKREAVEAALPDYMRFANIREMHQASAVGVAQDAAVDERGLYIAARIIDDDAWQKVKAGVYKGFSIGGNVLQRDRLDRSIVTACMISEISLVDRPANAECVFDIYKAGAVTGPAPGRAATATDLAANAAQAAAGLLATLEPEAVQVLHDAAILLGAVCADHGVAGSSPAHAAAAGADTAASAPSDRTGKAGPNPAQPPLGAEPADMLAKIAELDGEISALRQQIETLGARPAAGGAVLKVVGKAEDDSNAMPVEADDAVSAIRKAQRQPLLAQAFLMR